MIKMKDLIKKDVNNVLFEATDKKKLDKKLIGLKVKIKKMMMDIVTNQIYGKDKDEGRKKSSILKFKRKYNKVFDVWYKDGEFTLVSFESAYWETIAPAFKKTIKKLGFKLKNIKQSKSNGIIYATFDYIS